MNLDHFSTKLYYHVLQNAQTSHGFDRSAVEREEKELSQNFENSNSDLYRNKIVTYSLPDNEELVGTGSPIVTPFNRASVERAPQSVSTYSGEYYGAASNIGRNFENRYYGMLTRVDQIL